MKFTKPIYISVFYVALALAYFYVIEHYYGWRHILQGWSGIGAVPMVGTFCLVFATWYIRALRVCDYFSLPLAASLSGCLRVVLLHNLINSIFPARSGEVSFPLLMKNEFSLPVARSATALLILRLLDFHVLVLIGAVLYFLLYTSIFLACVLIPMLVLFPLLLFGLKEFLFKKISAHKEFIGQRLLLEIISATPKNKSLLLRSWLLTVLCWVIKISVYGFIVLCFANVSFLQANMAAFFGELGSIIPLHTPGSLGTYEAGMLGLSRLFGLEGDWIMLAAVQLHLVIIVSTLLGGIIAAMIRGNSARQLEKTSGI